MNSTFRALSRHVNVKGERKLAEIISKFSLVERIVFSIFIGIFVVSSISMALIVNDHYKVSIPAHGGTLTEGLVGSPRFVNPVLAMSDIDKDLTTLIYSGLMKISSNGEIVNDLADSFTLSEDKTVYTFHIRDNASFQDSSPVTSDDVIFTIQKIVDPAMKSPKRANWEGILVEKIDNKNIRFTLKKPYAGFLEATTLGIIPKNIWRNVSTEKFPFSNFNIQPIGSGPFKISGVEKDSEGALLSYTLTPFDRYVGGEAYISNFITKFYQNEDEMFKDYQNGTIDNISGLSTEKAKEISLNNSTKLITPPLARSFAVFFNQNQSLVLRNAEVRTALAQAVDRNEIIQKALNGYATPLYGPIPPIAADTPTPDTVTDKLKTQDIKAAKDLLIKNGWTLGSDGVFEKKITGAIATKVVKANKVTPAKNNASSTASTTSLTATSTTAVTPVVTDKKDVIRLEFSISTSNAPDLKKAAEVLKSEWEAIGAKVTVKVFESGDLNQNVIRPRKYDVLLFGEVIGRDLDLYAFWHSSQRNDPGLNISMYANTDSDKLLEDMRGNLDDKTRADKLNKWAGLLKNDLPALFLFSPDFVYALSNKVIDAKISYISRSSDRWNGIEKWYVSTDKVWQIFTK
ncbi:MAG: ABC transporter substrate-binding protein [bacterium]